MRLRTTLTLACAFTALVAALDVVSMCYPPWMKELPRLWIARCRITFDCAAFIASGAVCAHMRSRQLPLPARAIAWLKYVASLGWCAIAGVSAAGTIWSAVELARGDHPDVVVGTANFLWETVLVAAVVLYCAHVLHHSDLESDSAVGRESLVVERGEQCACDGPSCH
ncbi:hypothetical protein AB1Y20_007082 [Prymnesium parvum]|uniref:Transmembrane protein 163 n=1 Tax=Prymnesium parvum TaxID=97485 RepID=A0AB34J060_PRYPA